MMSETVENINRKIKFQLDTLLFIFLCFIQLIRLLNDNGLSSHTSTSMTTIPNLTIVEQRYKQIENMNEEYQLQTVDILSRYYTGEDINEDYTKQILIEQYTTKLHDFINIAESYLIILKKNIDVNSNSDISVSNSNTNPNDISVSNPDITTHIYNIQRSIDDIQNVTITIGNSSNQNKFQECICGYQMTATDCSKMKCEQCGKLRMLCGTVFEKSQLGLADDDKTSANNGYSSNKHYKFWIEKTLAEERKELSEETSIKIKDKIKQKNIKYGKIRYRQMRQILKELHLTELNKHIPWLMKNFNGLSPPTYSFNEKKKNAIIFDKIIAIHDKIQDDDRNNRRYYPFFILKAAENQFQVLPTDTKEEAAYKREKLRIALFIHLQNSGTVKKHDAKYKEICEYHKQYYPNEDPLFYKPTDRANINEGELGGLG